MYDFWESGVIFSCTWSPRPLRLLQSVSYLTFVCVLVEEMWQKRSNCGLEGEQRAYPKSDMLMLVERKFGCSGVCS